MRPNHSPISAALSAALLAAAACGGSAPGSTIQLGSAATSAEIQAARDAADGTGLALPIHGAYVTYVRPAVGADVAGFFIQSQTPGPALFVAVDPATLAPAPAEGDQVDLTVTAMATVASRREATALTGWAVLGSGAAIGTLQKELSGATDLVSGVDGYEGELALVTGQLRTEFTGSGSGFVAAGLNTSGVANDPLLVFRAPTALRDELGLTLGCTVTLALTPLWRGDLAVQVTAWKAADLAAVSCPAPRVLGAIALSATSVLVTFDRDLDPSSVATDGSQFTFTGGLSATAASAGIRTVTVTTGAQASDAVYTVTVAGSLHDQLGEPVDPAFDQATFDGWVQPATLLLDEVNASINLGADLIELRAATGGSTRDVVLAIGVATPNVLATLPDVTVAAGDLVVVHLSPAAGVVTETSAKGDCTDPACYSGAWDVAGEAVSISDTTRILTVLSPLGVITDAVPFTDGSTAGTGGSYLSDLEQLQLLGLWLPADCGGDVCSFTTTPSALAISVDWSGMGTAPTGDSVRRISTTDTDAASDWAVGPSSFGAAN